MELCPHGPGFDPVGEDVDDCKVIPGLCSHGTCINTLGSFRCACDHGYEPSRSKQACLDVNECVRTPSPCSFDCRNTMGGYQCVCPAGYQLDRDGSACVGQYCVHLFLIVISIEYYTFKLCNYIPCWLCNLKLNVLISEISLLQKFFI